MENSICRVEIGSGSEAPAWDGWARATGDRRTDQSDQTSTIDRMETTPPIGEKTTASGKPGHPFSRIGGVEGATPDGSTESAGLAGKER